MLDLVEILQEVLTVIPCIGAPAGEGPAVVGVDAEPAKRRYQALPAAQQEWFEPYWRAFLAVMEVQTLAHQGAFELRGLLDEIGDQVLDAEQGDPSLPVERARAIAARLEHAIERARSSHSVTAVRAARKLGVEDAGH